MSEFEQRARALKAHALANVCTEAGIHDITNIDPERKAFVLKGARVLNASDKTWESVQRILEERARLDLMTDDELWSGLV